MIVAPLSSGSAGNSYYVESDGTSILVDAGLGRKEEALREGRRAVELRPLAEDAVDGATVLGFLAMIHAWLGDANKALDELEILARIPNGVHFGQLKYDPAWDAVRGDPRFTRPFLDVLRWKHDVWQTLREMHSAGVLCALFPEFQRIDCLVQRNLYRFGFTARAHLDLARKLLEGRERFEVMQVNQERSFLQAVLPVRLSSATTNW